MKIIYTKLKSFPYIIILLVLGLSVAAADTSTYHVTIPSDSGTGSLRYALSKKGVIRIVLLPEVRTIKIKKPLIYNGKMPLIIVGSGQTISGEGLGMNLLEVTNGADLTISDLSFTDDRSYSVNRQGGGSGIKVKVPPNRTGSVFVSLIRVNVTGVGDHGIHVLDCDRVDCGSGSNGDEKGSRASISLTLDEVFIRDVGNGHFDADGIRVDERGEGDLIFNATNSSFIGVGADGIKLDEGGSGSVKITADNLVMSNNGSYCSTIRLARPPYADDRCVEDNGRRPVLDLDDGFDVDEAGPGSITGRISDSKLILNFDEGLDFDEEDAGDVDIGLINVYASQNKDEGVNISEEDEGDIKVKLRAVQSVRNFDDGIQIKEEDGGNLGVIFNGVITRSNRKFGANVKQRGPGRGYIVVKHSQIDKLYTKGVKAK